MPDNIPQPGGECGYTPIPHAVFDLMSSLSGAEWKLLTLLLRLTVGWHKQEDSVSRAQIGRLTGLNRATISTAVAGLAKRGLITVEQAHGPGGKMTINRYRVAFSSHGENPHEYWPPEEAPASNPHEHSVLTVSPLPYTENATQQKIEATKNSSSSSRPTVSHFLATEAATEATSRAGHEPDEAITALRQAGVDQARAQQLVRDYGSARVRRNVAGVRNRAKRYGPGAYVQAVKEDWYPEDAPAPDEDLGPESRRPMNAWLEDQLRRLPDTGAGDEVRDQLVAQGLMPQKKWTLEELAEKERALGRRAAPW